MARGATPGVDGLCIVDKAPGLTSHDVVGRARRVLGTRKVGHAGTLDPMATGVLVLGVGRATRLLTHITGVDKTYEASIRFGAETDSLDADGIVVAEHDMEPPTAADLAAAAQPLTGDILQVPPMVSALKVDGRRLHELAREGVEVERKARPVTVSQFELRPTADPMVWDATVTCSSGTYVRVLAADLGRRLGGGAHLVGLRRTAVGPFLIEEATPVDEAVLLPMVEAVRHLDATTVDSDVARIIGFGSVLESAQLGEPAGSGPWAVLDRDGSLLAVYGAHGDGRYKPSVVVAAQG